MGGKPLIIDRMKAVAEEGKQQASHPEPELRSQQSGHENRQFFALLVEVLLP